MTGCRSLLAVCALILFPMAVVAPALLLGQDSASVERPVLAGSAGARAVIPVSAPKLAPNLPPLRYPSPIAPVWIPPPNLPRPYPVAPGTNGLQQLVQAAGIIFSGRVTSVGRGTSISGPNAAATTVTFQVEHAMRGASPGQSLTIHEWAGLWNRGERYQVGERVLLLLYSPSKLGFTSPVAGDTGRFALNSEGGIVMSAQHLAMFGADPIMAGRAIVPYADFAAAVRLVEPREIGAP
jgi:hypothetical protein